VEQVRIQAREVGVISTVAEILEGLAPAFSLSEHVSSLGCRKSAGHLGR